jgi:hypothetical protein
MAGSLWTARAGGDGAGGPLEPAGPGRATGDAVASPVVQFV